MKIKEVLDEIDGYCAFEVTLKVQYLVKKGYTDKTPEALAKEWFNGNYALLVQPIHSHAFRDGSKIGNSEEIINVKIFKNENKITN